MLPFDLWYGLLQSQHSRLAVQVKLQLMLITRNMCCALRHVYNYKDLHT